MSFFESLLLGKILFDINAQPNLFHRSFLTHVKNPPQDFSFDLYAYHLAKSKGYSVIRFPVYFGRRQYGESAWNHGVKDKWKFLKNIRQNIRKTEWNMKEMLFMLEKTIINISQVILFFFLKVDTNG